MRTFQEYALDKSDRIGRYIAYMAKTRDISLDESARRSLARIFDLIQTSQNPILIMTAFRGERDLMANRAANVNLEADFRRLGWGFTPVLGGFTEKVRDEQGQETGELKKIENEESYFVSASMANTNNKQFLERVKGLLEKYRQEAAVVKLPDDDRAFLIHQSGDLNPLGNWTIDKMADYYTKMRKGPPDRQFSFEAAGDLSVFTMMGVDNYFETHG